MIQHISVRVPWHDNGWDGTVCRHPDLNGSCLRLKNIHENRDDEAECRLCGQCLAGHESEVPCVGEGGAFMSDKELRRTTVHPYAENNPGTHGHFLPTELVYPPYSFPARPYAWLMKDRLPWLSERYGIDYDERREPELGFRTTWIQEGRNQKNVFGRFFRDVTPGRSLCIAYAKQVPFTDSPGRVVVGVGFVEDVVPAVEYGHTDEKPLRSMTWETHVCHSIRADGRNGFLIPYGEMQGYAERNPGFDMNDITVFAPSESFDEFSYATEHLSYDSVIDVLTGCIRSFGKICRCLGRDYGGVISWLKERLDEVWEERGAFPGLGSMLTAFGIPMGIPAAAAMADSVPAGGNMWEAVDAAMSDPGSMLPPDIARQFTPGVRMKWSGLSPRRRELFELLSRFSLSPEQAEILFPERKRKDNGIDCSDDDIIGNPYILYERTRLMREGRTIPIKKVDRAVLPAPSVLERYPLPGETDIVSDDDWRRVRAIAVAVLERAAGEGHTILPSDMLERGMEDMRLDRPCRVTSDYLDALSGRFEPEVVKKEAEDGSEYYKLKRLGRFDDAVEKRVNKLLTLEPLSVDADWRGMMDDKFGPSDSETEDRAREEKAAVLRELASSRISVLTGGAGTGKTTVLSILCGHPDIKRRGVLLLAPTGKATVRLSESMGGDAGKFTAQNVAQFLYSCGRFDPDDMRYILPTPGTQCAGVPDTVIIDEASMLTEEMFGSLMDALRTAKRLIFVGDPNQLPPIGAGRPFVDLVRLLKGSLAPGVFPRVRPHYGELTVNRRQRSGGRRTDVELARMFVDGECVPDFGILEEAAEGGDGSIRITRWDGREDLEEKLLAAVAEAAGMAGPDDGRAFDLSLGGTASGGYVYFNKGAAAKADAWQILAPVRNMPHGTAGINRLLHLRYRAGTLELSERRGKEKRIAKALGPEGIVYGDKVINVVNTSDKKADPAAGARNYIANGEIGIACGGFRPGRKSRDDGMTVEFSAQPGYTYCFDGRDFDSENGTDRLELAYALTVHKAQGSQFGTVILVISEPCPVMSRELMYTALTRQADRIVILYNREPHDLLRYSSPERSDIARRFTDLFAGMPDGDGNEFRPRIVEHGGSFFEENLIHRTDRDELVRSKSEVIIANELYNHGLDYEYEPELELEGRPFRPDFRISDPDTGTVRYWEHCGMMSDPGYRRRWEEKKEVYERNGIREGENLIVTYDDANGGIDSFSIKRLIEETFAV